MTLDALMFEDISERDLAALIGVRSGWTLEFLPAAEGFRFGAEVCSLANTKGGHLLIGIEVERREAKRAANTREPVSAALRQGHEPRAPAGDLCAQGHGRLRARPARGDGRVFRVRVLAFRRRS
jgi:hypothetical protein